MVKSGSARVVPEEQQIADLLFDQFRVRAGRGLNIDLGDAQVAGRRVEEAEAVGEAGNRYENLIVGVGCAANLL